MSEIESHIENEFKEEDLELQTETARVNILIEEHKNNLSKKQDFKELHTIYKDCIRKIHPDLLLEPTDYEENLFYSSKEAYEDRDLDELKSAQNLIGRHEIENEPITVEDFEKLRNKLEINIELEDKEISNIVNSKPYTQQKFLLDTKKVNILIEEHKNNLSKKQDFKELHTIYKDCIRKIHRDLFLEPTD